MSRILTSGRVRKPFNPLDLPGLVEFWTLQEASGSAVGLLGALTLTVSSGSIGTTTGPTTNLPAARAFNATNFLTVSNPCGRLDNVDWTFGAWIKGTGSAMGAGSIYQTSANLLGVLAIRPAVAQTGGQVGDQTIRGNPAVTADTWNLICVQYDAAHTRARYQVRGEATIVGNNSSAPILSSTAPGVLTIGKDSGGGYTATLLTGAVAGAFLCRGAGAFLTEELITQLAAW